MTPFLKQVTLHCFGNCDFSKTMFIFPNRRSMVFFKEHLRRTAAESSRTTMLPRMTTVSDFYSKVSGGFVADRITLLSQLYDCYCRLNPKAESFDEFVYWGDVLLADFNDVDKYCVDADRLFTNIADFKALADDYCHTTEVQRKAILKLVSNFDRWDRETASDKDARKTFLMLWEIMKPLYGAFREALCEKGLSYEGMVYRKVADRLRDESVTDMMAEAFPDMSMFVFVGLNVLTECEMRVMRHMRDAGIAQFCWDFSGDLLKDPSNIAGKFMSANLREFPNAFEPEGGDGKPNVHVVSVASASGQARLLPQIIEGVDSSERGLDFAVVLADESMLGEVLRCIPSSVQDVNVTMGCPVAGSEWATLMDALMTLQIHAREREGEHLFYYKHVYEILSSGIVKGAMNDDEKAVVEKVLGEARYYIPASDFAGKPLLGVLFAGVALADAEGERPGAGARAMADYLMAATSTLVPLLDEESMLVKEMAMQYYKCVSRLRDYELAVLPQTWSHLLMRLVGGLSVPFEGEPLGGLQIMGPLETRSLDFKHVVIVNANEGVFPRRSYSASFVPPELRTAFGLPTYEKQDAVWAYYFYRLISRAENVWMIYDSRVSRPDGQEESRYIKQLNYAYGDKCNIDFSVAGSVVCNTLDDSVIPKTQEDIDIIRSATYSASSLEKYISCPASFYYRTVKKIYPKDEVKETLDPGLMGNVCHDTLEALVCGEEEMHSDKDFDKRSKDDDTIHEVTLEYLEDWLHREEEIRAKVCSLICHKLHCPEVKGVDLITADVATNFVMQVIRRDVEKLRETKRKSFKARVETECRATICGHKFYGFLDRLDDMDGEGILRVVDYKTGSDDPKVLSLKAGKAKDIFDQNHSYENKARLQFFIYDEMVRQNKRLRALAGEKGEDPIIHNAMYAMKDMFGNKVESHEVNPDLESEILEKLRIIFDEMENPDVGFKRTPGNSERNCTFCDYKSLCGKA